MNKAAESVGLSRCAVVPQVGDCWNRPMWSPFPALSCRSDSVTAVITAMTAP